MGLLLTIPLLVANTVRPVLVVTQPVLAGSGYVIMVLGAAVGAALLVRRSHVGVVVPFVLFTALVACLGLLVGGARSVLVSLEPVRTLGLPDGGSMVAYRTNGGATTDFGVVVRQERQLLPGVRLVRTALEEDHADDVTDLATAGLGTVRVTLTPTQQTMAITRELDVRILVYGPPAG